jgi:hypothetical protein
MTERVFAELPDLLVIPRPWIVRKSLMQEIERVSLVFPENSRAIESVLRAQVRLVETRLW